MDKLQTQCKICETICPACGYYCSGKGGIGCIYKNSHKCSNFPDGKIRDDDEGELKIELKIIENRLVIDFNKETAWLGFDKTHLIGFINALQSKYMQLK